MDYLIAIAALLAAIWILGRLPMWIAGLAMAWRDRRHEGIER